MTEQEWLRCDDRYAIVNYLWDKHLFDQWPSNRKLKLFARASYRMNLEAHDRRLDAALDLLERNADGLAPDTEVMETAQALGVQIKEGEATYEFLAADFYSVANVLGYDIQRQMACAVHNGSKFNLIALLAEMFGNPFQPIAFDPRWRTEDVVGVARMIYDEHRFDLMPMLSDALRDAGCDERRVHKHCRSDRGTPHVRGCWLLDLTLGKS